MSKKLPFTVARVRGRMERDVRVLRKRIQQNKLPRTTPCALFIVGTQRSGTNMLDGVLNNSVETTVYNEDHPHAFVKYRLRPRHEIQQLIQRQRSPWVVFKPLCDSQHIDKLLDTFQGSKAVWIYRNHHDVIRSTLKKWPKTQINHVRRIVEGDPAHFSSERVSDEYRALMSSFYNADMLVQDAAALKWLVRNNYFFEYGLFDQPDRVLLINYDRLVSQPEVECRRLFEFIGIVFDPAFVEFVHSTSKRNTPVEGINPEIVRLCNEMLARFDAVLERQRSDDTKTASV
jgi:Sulfotransferase domain